MNLSSETLAILKNFASINSNIVFRGGNVIKTISESKHILASAQITEDLPDAEFGIYDLNEFLGVLGMFESPDLKFAEDMKSILAVEGSRSVRYFFSDPEVLTYPTKDIAMPKADVSFSLSADDLASIRRASSVLSAPDVVISGESGTGDVTLLVTDTEDSTANSFNIGLEGATRDEDASFRLVFKVANLAKLMGSNYRVDVSSRMFSHLVSSEGVIEYWVALDSKHSTFSKE